MTAQDTIATIGHSTRPLAEFIGLLRENGVRRLVDVRTVPRSRTNPQFYADTLPQALAEAEIDYRHLPALGGLRHRAKGASASPNTLWRNDAFRNYADYATTDEFRAALGELCDLARDRRSAIMCAEAVWWRCHRRIVADYLLLRGFAVDHIMGPGRTEPAKLTPGAETQADGTILYAKAPTPDLFAGA